MDHKLLVNNFKLHIQLKQVGLHQKFAIMAQEPAAEGDNAEDNNENNTVMTKGGSQKEIAVSGVAITGTQAAHGGEDEFGSCFLC